MRDMSGRRISLKQVEQLRALADHAFPVARCARCGREERTMTLAAIYVRAKTQASIFYMLCDACEATFNLCKDLNAFAGECEPLIDSFMDSEGAT